MDKLYSQAPILNRRRQEWEKENIRRSVENIFRSIDIIDGWSFVSCKWSSTKRTKRYEELKGNALSVLKVVVNNSYGKDINYDIQIPNLIENQFFYIGGHLKIPMLSIDYFNTVVDD